MTFNKPPRILEKPYWFNHEKFVLLPTDDKKTVALVKLKVSGRMAVLDSKI